MGENTSLHTREGGVRLPTGISMRYGIPSLGALQAFEATARLGSFSRAAEELSLTHSAVFRQVSGLEERLGVTLFTRVRRRLVLTSPGQEYAARIRHHLEQIEKDTFSLVSQAGVGRSLHIAVLPTLATVWMMPRLARFSRLHPDVAVSLSVRTLPFQFNDHPFDAAIYHAASMWPQTSGFKLFDERGLVPVCTAQLASRGTIQDWTHLHMRSRPDNWRDWYKSSGLASSRSVNAGPRYELYTMILAAVRADMGVALMPRFLVEPFLESGELTMPVPHSLQVSDSYFFSYPTSTEPSDALRLFERWLASNSAEDVYDHV